MAEYPVRAALAGVLLFVIGLAIAASTLITEWRDRQARDAWIAVTGTVVDTLPAPANGSPRPVVSFDTPEGERIRFTPAGRATLRTPQVGETVAVIYPFGLPTQARLDPRSLRWLRTGVALASAVVLMALGGSVSLYARRRARETASAVE
jgi:hypothetical protein